MTMDMNDTAVTTLEQVAKFLKASKGWKFKGLTRDEKYNWLEDAIRRFDYYSRRKKEKGLLRRYMMLITGFHEAQLDRLLQQKLFNGEIKVAWGRRNKFPFTYTREDIELLAETDNLHERLAGPATKTILAQEFEFGDKRYLRLSGISVSHIYNLRERPAYRFKALTVSRTKSVQVGIGKRAKPNPRGKPGHLRVDTVHQGDLNGIKGVYHINMVDEVTQWQIIACVEAISEDWLKDVLEAAILMFPFFIRGFHSDNGGEFINGQVAGMLGNLLIKQSKSRSGRCNDNALVEGKNGSVIRKHMGYWHIERRHADGIHRFYMDYFNIYLNYHRPCGFATISVDEKGKRHRTYETYQTPYQAFMALKKPKRYLREGVRLEDLEKIAKAHSANGYARLMQDAKDKLFREVLPKGTKTLRNGGLAEILRRANDE
jgi:transposase InsO family protein